MTEERAWLFAAQPAWPGARACRTSTTGSSMTWPGASARRAAAVLPMVRAVSSLGELRAVIGDDAGQVWDAWWRHPGVDPSEKAVLTDIDSYGWHGLWIREDDDGPRFTYSIGFYRTLGAPEVIVVGIRPELAHSMLWEAYRRVRRGETLAPGRFYDDFLEGHAVTFVNVSDDARREYFGFAHLYYKGDFPALQLVWPSAADGRWPWDSEGLARLQPVLGPAPPAGPVPPAA